MPKLARLKSVLYMSPADYKHENVVEFELILDNKWQID